VARPSLFLTASALALFAPVIAAQSPAPSPRPRADAGKPKATPVPPKRVFTNDDLEAGRTKPSAVQDLQAKEGTGVGYEHAREDAPSPSSEPTPEPTPTLEEQHQQQVTAAEEQVRQLDERAKELLWQYLQSSDTNEINRLKAEQQEVLNQLEAAKADLARIQAGAPPPGSRGPASEPTRQPG
jgi:TolA-binding protein